MHNFKHLPEFMWVHAKKIGDGLEVYISEDSFDWMQIRQGDITDDSILQIGLYGASPRSDDGDDLSVASICNIGMRANKKAMAGAVQVIWDTFTSFQN